MDRSESGCQRRLYQGGLYGEHKAARGSDGDVEICIGEGESDRDSCDAGGLCEPRA